MGETLEQAVQAAMNDTGLPRDEVADDDAYELDEAEMQRMKFVDDDGVTKRTFAEELQRRIESGKAKPEMFASTEY